MKTYGLLKLLKLLKLPNIYRSTTVDKKHTPPAFGHPL
jgi:hypothetical protein